MIEISLKRIILKELPGLLAGEISLADDAVKAVKRCRTYLDDKLANGNDVIYGINTGFGSLCDTKVSTQDLAKLQLNLVRSHACGIGRETEVEVIQLMLLFKIIGLSRGYSGIDIKTMELMVKMYNKRIFPVVYQQGSLGASGDLAPLAHLALSLVGEGEVWYKGKKWPTVEVFEKEGLKAVQLQSKEGLALLNGTQYMSAHAAHCYLKGKHLLKWANFLAAASLDAFMGLSSPFDHDLHALRGHDGAIVTAQEIREWLKGSELQEQPKNQVQDPYSFRCVPQVHGQVYDALAHAENLIEKELNAVTDNPTIFPDQDKIISGGNFHGEPMAMVLDYMKLAIAELGSISERRVYKLISGQRDLPPFLVKKPGLNSGLMIPQYTAASLVSANKQLATPACVDTIDSSNGQEDHVSMGANAANQLLQMIHNTTEVLGIELINTSQALWLREPLKPAPKVVEVLQAFRKVVPVIEEDRFFSEDMRAAKEFVLKSAL